MESYEDQIKKASRIIKDTEYILVGAGAGLSDAAGIKFSGKRFTDNFTDFIEKYGIEDLYSSSFYPFKTMEEKWAYWARHISLNRFDTPATQLYKELYKLVKNKKYFVLTTNVDHQFWKAGFPDEKIFATQGDYGFVQCASGCHNQLYNDKELVIEMLRKTKDCTIPTTLVPKCPVCGGEMDVNLRKDEYFIQDEVWYRASENYQAFVEEVQWEKVVFMELGVGFNTPGIIRHPFERMTYQNPDAVLIRLNKEYAEGISENKYKTISFENDMMEVITALA